MAVILLPSRRDLPYLGIVAVVLSTLLLYPLNDDNGHWQSMALELLRYGKWPYVGTWDQNFPGVILFHITSILLLGPTDVGFRALDFVLQLGFCWLLFRLWRRWLTERQSWLAVLLYAFAYVRNAPFIGGQRDTFAAMIIVAITIQLLGYERPRLRTIFLLGLAGGVAVLIRPTYEAYLLLIAASTSLRQGRFAAMLFLIAGLAPLALSFGLYGLWPGALQEDWLATGRFNLDT